MENIYIKFQMRNDEASQKTQSRLTRILENMTISILTKIIPKANPDFEGKINDVHEWMLELDVDSELPGREIGLDKRGDVIMIMPWDNNYGYWTDNNLKIDDFIDSFSPILINEDEFEMKWNEFEKRNQK